MSTTNKGAQLEPLRDFCESLRTCQQFEIITRRPPLLRLNVPCELRNPFKLKGINTIREGGGNDIDVEICYNFRLPFISPPPSGEGLSFLLFLDYVMRRIGKIKWHLFYSLLDSHFKLRFFLCWAKHTMPVYNSCSISCSIVWTWKRTRLSLHARFSQLSKYDARTFL